MWISAIAATLSRDLEPCAARSRPTRTRNRSGSRSPASRGEFADGRGHSSIAEVHST